MTGEQVVEALRLMTMSRALDELCTKLQRMGRIGLYGPVHGQEAAVVGSAMALDPERDWIVPASREQPAMLRHGWPLDNLLAAYMGRLEQAVIPPGVRLLTRQQSIGAQLPHAAGLAWALKLRAQAGAVMVYCGDGASSEGDFHEACNLAGVMSVPLVIVLINNAYAISTPVSKQTAGSLAARALGYGFPGIAVDGNDLFAVHLASSQAVARALAGDGPTLIECRTYRVGFHNTTDNPNEYRDAAEVEEAVARDPLVRLRRYAVESGLTTNEELQLMADEVALLLDGSQHRVAALPRPGPGAVFDHVYEEPPARVRQQREETLARSGPPPPAGAPQF
jgi:TPP-dependent pyruvate/acetoin dehydrogenase alpha subunit